MITIEKWMWNKREALRVLQWRRRWRWSKHKQSFTHEPPNSPKTKLCSQIVERATTKNIYTWWWNGKWNFDEQSNTQYTRNNRKRGAKRSIDKRHNRKSPVNLTSQRALNFDLAIVYRLTLTQHPHIFAVCVSETIKKLVWQTKELRGNKAPEIVDFVLSFGYLYVFIVGCVRATKTRSIKRIYLK